MHYLFLGDALGLVLIDALGFVLVNALGVVFVDTFVMCNPSCNKFKNYCSNNLWIAVWGVMCKITTMWLITIICGFVYVC